MRRMRPLGVMVALATAVTVLTVMTSVPAASATPAGTIPIVNPASAKCLDLAGWDTTDDAWILQWECNGGANQQWEIIPFYSDGGVSFNYYIKNQHSKKCLDVTEYEHGARVTQSEAACSYWQPTLWDLEPQGAYNGWAYYLVRATSGLCLDLWNSSSDNGAYIRLGGCHGMQNQLWRVPV